MGMSDCYWKHCHWGKNYWEVLLGRDLKKNLNLLNLEESIGDISLATGAIVMMQLTGSDQQCASWILALALFQLLLLLSFSVCLSCVLFESCVVVVKRFKNWGCFLRLKTGSCFFKLSCVTKFHY